MPKQFKKAIAYLRVSTDGQDQDGNGFDLQTTAIREFARHEGFRIVNTFRDAQTGMGEDKLLNRPGAVAAYKLSKLRGWPIIVDGLDRFSRNTKTLEELIADQRLKIISCRSGEGASHAVIMAEAARAQHEGELISLNTKRALQKLKEQGVQLGNPTNLPDAQLKGAAKNRAYAEERTQELAPAIQELRQGGKSTAQEIADGLNRKGFQTARGASWKVTNVRRLIKRVDELAIAQRAAVDAERYEGNSLWGAF